MLLIEQLINGLVLGSTYALIALGYTLVFGVLDKLNFAHGDLFMLGGFMAVASTAMGAPIWVGVLAALLFVGVLGLVVELVSFRKFTSRDAQVTAALSSFGLALVMVDLAQKFWGTEPVQLKVPAPLRMAALEIENLRIPYINIAILATTAILLLVLWYVVTHTVMGRRIRAVADSAVSASLLGVNVVRVNQQTFFLASALAGLAGVMLSMRTGFVTTELGATYGIKALAVMAIGGMGDMRGAVVGGILAGLVEAFAFQLGLGKFGELAVWLMMIGILIVRPTGLFGTGKEQRA
jgi:branched-chain amino acid transport system permease protein